MSLALALALALAVMWLVGPVGAAQASCVPLDQRPSSPHVFTGVVVSTSLGGRVAVVRTDAGEEVVVRGTTVSADNEMTSADRAYVVGGRYEFHPYNARSPFEDNACSLTVLLGTATIDMSNDVVFGTTHLDAGAVALASAAGVFVVGAGVVLAVRNVRRRRPRRERPEVS